MLRKDLLLTASIITAASLPAHAALIDYQMNDANGTDLTGLAQTGTEAVSVSGATPQVTTNGTGELVFSQGADTGDNIFRNTSPDLDINSGVYELDFVITDATILGDGAGANVGFGFRDNVSGDTLFVIRLQVVSNTMRLQTRIGNDNTNLHNFGTSTLAGQALTLKAVVDLDTDLMDVYWSGAANGQMLDMAITDGDFDALRIQANTNTDDWGVNDFANVDFVTVTAVPEPGSLALLGLGGLLVARRRRG